MSDVFWKVNKPDTDGVVWVDLRDRNSKDKRNWVLTYRETKDKWIVLYKDIDNNADEYIDKATMSEEQLRNNLKLQYLLTRGET